jgi:hypothetical protein
VKSEGCGTIVELVESEAGRPEIRDARHAAVIDLKKHMMLVTGSKGGVLAGY